MSKCLIAASLCPGEGDIGLHISLVSKHADCLSINLLMMVGTAVLLTPVMA